MAPRTLQFVTALQPDAPLRQDARYVFGAEDRQQIDSQILGVQSFLARTHLNGVSATYLTFTGDPGAAGDVVCSANGLNGKPTVTLATSAALLNAGGPLGILLEAATQGTRALVAWGGILGPEVTGLATSSPGWVRVTSNRCQYVATLIGSDYAVGWVDDGGFLTIGKTPLADVDAGVLTLTAEPPIAVDLAAGDVTVSWLPDENVPMLGYGFTSCSGVTNAGGALALTAGGGAASLAGSTTATVSANGGALLCEGATTATITAGTALACTGGTTAALTASGGAATITGSTNVALTATAGDVVVTAGDDVSITATDDITITASGTTDIAGDDVRMTGVADGTSGYLAISAAGVLSRGPGGSGASTLARYLTASATAINANDQPIEDLAAGLVFACDADAPVRLRRDDASGTGTLDVLVVGRTNSGGGGAITIGTGVRWDIHDADETQVEAARIAAVATDVTAGAHSSKITFEGADAGSLSTLGWWDADGLHVSTDLIVAGTTTTVDSTSVTVADRLVVFNSSTGTVPVPVAIAGFVIDRGSTDGITKRDAPGVLWDEPNSRVAIAYNTALDQSTIGTYVTVKVGGLISPSLDNPSGAVAIGASGTSVTVTPDTTFSGVLTELRPGITTTVTPGVIASNATAAATPSPLVQYGPAFISSGGAWETGGGGSPKTTRGGFYTRGLSSGTAGAEVVFIYDTGGGTFSEGGRITTNLPGVGGVGFVAPTLVCDGGNGIRFVSSSTDRGNVKWSGSAIELNGGSNPITIASTVGATINVRTVTPRVVSAADAVTSTAGATTFDFSRAANIEHTTTEDTTVSFASLIAGQSGTLVFIQGATGRTITMPSASSTIKYSEALVTLGVTAMVHTSASYITIFHYRTTTGGVILVHAREVLPS